VKNEKEQTEGNNCSFSEKESFFLNARERILYTLRLLFALQREREREKKRNEEDALHPSEKRSKVSSFSLVFFLLTPSSIYF
jgi:hypothetical protein